MTTISCNTINDQKVIQSYNTTHSMYKSAKELNISPHFVRKTLMKNGITLNSSLYNTKHKLKNEFCFDNIDCEWKAYFLGLLCADGNLCKRVVRISLQEKDNYILYKLGEFLYTDTIPICKNNRRRKSNHQLMFTLNINNIHIYQSIKNLNIHERKSFDLQFPNIPTEYLHHFIRGYFDGDGSISRYKNRPASFSCSIIGSKLFMEKLQMILLNNQIKSQLRIQTKQKVYILTISSKIQMEKFKNFIYHNSNIYLQRKLDKFNEISKTIKNRLHKYKKGKYKYIRYEGRKKTKNWFFILNKKRNYFFTEDEAYNQYKLLTDIK